MFETESSDYYQDVPYTVHTVFKNKEDIGLEIWVEHFSRPCKERNKSLNNIFETYLVFMKRKYIFLEASQIMGKTLSAFGIENVCGEVSKSFLQKFKKRKNTIKNFKRTKKFKNTKLFGPQKKKICKKTIRTSEHLEKILIPRYSPVVERWSDAVFRKFKDITGSKDNTKDQLYIFSNDENQMNKPKEVNKSFKSFEVHTSTSNENLYVSEIYENQSDFAKINNSLHTDKVGPSHKQYQNTLEFNLQSPKKQLGVFKDKSEQKNGLNNGKININIEETNLSDNSEFWSTTAIVNDSGSKNSKVLKENIKKRSFKKSVRFDDNLCSFAPTPQYFKTNQEQNGIDFGNVSDKANCFDKCKVLSDTPEATKGTKFFSESEHIFDKLLKNSKDINITNTIESEYKSIPGKILTETSKENTDSSKADELTSSTLPLKLHTYERKNYELIPIDDETSGSPNKPLNHNRRITEESDYETDNKVEEISNNFSIDQSLRYPQDIHKMSFCIQPDQNPTNKEMLTVDQKSEKMLKNKTDTQNEWMQGSKSTFYPDKVRNNPKVGLQNGRGFLSPSKDEIVIEETLSFSEDIRNSASSDDLSSNINKLFRTANEQKVNTNSTSKESYSNEIDLISEKLQPQENSDEEYIPLSNCEEESFEYNSEVECEKENKPEVLSDMRTPQNMEVLMKHNTSFKGDIQENKFVSQCKPKKGKKHTPLSSKNMGFHILQNLSPTGSLSGREYLSDDSVLSSQYDSKEVSDTYLDKAYTEKINKSVVIEAQKFNKPAAQANKTEVKSKRSSEKNKLTCKLFNKTDSCDEHETQHVEKELDEYKSASVLPSPPSTVVDSSKSNMVSVDFSTPKSSKLSQADISRREILNIKVSNAPSKNKEIILNGDISTILDTPNAGSSKVSNAKLCKTLFPIEVLDENLHQPQSVINELKKREYTNACESPKTILFETCSEIENISKVASSQTNKTESYKYGINPNISPVAITYKKNNETKASEIKLNNHTSKPIFRVSFNEDLTDSKVEENKEICNEMEKIRHNNEKEDSLKTNNFNSTSTYLQNHNCDKTPNSVSVEEKIDNTSNNDLSSQDYTVESPISEGSLKKKVKSEDNKIRGEHINHSLVTFCSGRLQETISTDLELSNRLESNESACLNKIKGNEPNEKLKPTQSSQITTGKKDIENNSSTFTNPKSQFSIEISDDKFLFNSFENSNIDCKKTPLQKDSDEEYIPLSNCEESSEFNSDAEWDKENKPEVLSDVRKSHNKQVLTKLNTCFKGNFQENNFVDQSITKQEIKNKELLMPNKNMVLYKPQKLSPTKSLSDNEYFSEDYVLSSQNDSTEVSNILSVKAIAGMIKKYRSTKTQKIQKYNKLPVQANKNKTKQRVKSKKSSENKKLTSKLFKETEKYDDEHVTQHFENEYKSMSDFTSPTTSVMDYSKGNMDSVDFSTPQRGKSSQEDIFRRELVNYKMSNAPSKNKEIIINNSKSTQLDIPKSSLSKVLDTKLCKTLFPIELGDENLKPPHGITELKMKDCLLNGRSPITVQLETTSKRENISNSDSSQTKNIASYQYGKGSKGSPNANIYKKNNPNLSNYLFEPQLREELRNTQSLMESNEDFYKNIEVTNMEEIVNVKESVKPKCSKSSVIYLKKGNCVGKSNSVPVEEKIVNVFNNDLSSQEYIVASQKSEGVLKNRSEMDDKKTRCGEVNQTLIKHYTSKCKEAKSTELGLELKKLTCLNKIKGDESNEIVDTVPSSQIKVISYDIKNNVSASASSNIKLAVVKESTKNVSDSSFEDSEIIYESRPLQDSPNNEFPIGIKNVKVHKLNEEVRGHRQLNKSINPEVNTFSSVCNEESDREIPESSLHSISMFNFQTIVEKQNKREYFMENSTFSKNIEAYNNSRTMKQQTTENIYPNSIKSHINELKETQPQENTFRTTISDSSSNKSYNNILSNKTKNNAVCFAGNNSINVSSNTQGLNLEIFSQLDGSLKAEKPTFKRYYSTQKVHTHYKEVEANLNAGDNRLSRTLNLDSSPTDNIINSVINQSQTLSRSEDIRETEINGSVTTDLGNKVLMASPYTKYKSDFKRSGSNKSQLSFLKVNGFNESQSNNMETMQQASTISGRSKISSSDHVKHPDKILFGTSSPCKFEQSKKHNIKNNEHIGAQKQNNIFNSNSGKNHKKTKEHSSLQKNELEEHFPPKCNTIRQKNNKKVTIYSDSNSPIALKRAKTQNFMEGKNSSKYASSLKISLSKYDKFESKNNGKLKVPQLKTGERYDKDINCLSALHYQSLSSKPSDSDKNSNKTSSNDSSSNVNKLENGLLNPDESIRLNSFESKSSIKQAFGAYSEEDTSVSSFLSECKDPENEMTPRGDLSFLNLSKNSNIAFDIFKRYNENESTCETRKRKLNSWKEILHPSHQGKQKREKRTLHCPKDIYDSDNISIIRTKSCDSDDDSVCNSNFHFGNETDLASDEQDFEDDNLNSGPQNAFSGSQSSNNIIRNIQQGSDPSTVNTDSEFPLMGSGFFPSSPDSYNRSSKYDLANMFDPCDSSSMRSSSP